MFRSTLNLVNSTIVTDQPELSGFNITLRDSSDIFWVNSVITTTDEQAICSVDSFSRPPFFTNNWFSDASCNGVANGDPKLSPLRSNGGPTLTHAPLRDSPLADAGMRIYCGQSRPDQRGEPRGETTCFIGSVEGFFDISFLMPIISLLLFGDE